MQYTDLLTPNKPSSLATLVPASCHCDVGYTSADCSVPELVPPYLGRIPQYGLCDTRYMNCSRVIVYGNNFINSESLTCHFQECEVGIMYM